VAAGVPVTPSAPPIFMSSSICALYAPLAIAACALNASKGASTASMICHAVTMQRVLVVGSSGSGKTTLARALARALATPHVELDALFHGPSWQPRPSFVEEVERASLEPRWVIEGNYAPVRELLWARADTIVWLDLPRLLIEYRVIRRSFVRWLTREQLWNGNYEASPLRWIEREHPVRWSWIKTTLPRRVPAAVRRPGVRARDARSAAIAR